jgi:hypothetical protein
MGNEDGTESAGVTGLQLRRWGDESAKVEQPVPRLLFGTLEFRI